jgi:hypothetical protein
MLVVLVKIMQCSAFILCKACMYMQNRTHVHVLYNVQMSNPAVPAGLTNVNASIPVRSASQQENTAAAWAHHAERAFAASLLESNTRARMRAAARDDMLAQSQAKSNIYDDATAPPVIKELREFMVRVLEAVRAQNIYVFVLRAFLQRDVYFFYFYSYFLPMFTLL